MHEHGFITVCDGHEADMAVSFSRSSALHQHRGLGYSSRFCVSEDDLPTGWRCEKKSSKYTVWYDDRGNRYKSSVAVKRALEDRVRRVTMERSQKQVEKHLNLSLRQ